MFTVSLILVLHVSEPNLIMHVNAANETLALPFFAVQAIFNPGSPFL